MEGHSKGPPTLGWGHYLKGNMQVGTKEVLVPAWILAYDVLTWRNDVIKCAYFGIEEISLNDKNQSNA